MGSTLTSRCHARRSTAPGRATVALRQAGKRTMLPKSFCHFERIQFFTLHLFPQQVYCTGWSALVCRAAHLRALNARAAGAGRRCSA